MKLVIAVVQDQDAHNLIETLMNHNYRATKLASTGGFLRQGNTTLLIGVEDEAVDDVIAVIKDACKTRSQMLYTPSAIPETPGSVPLNTVEVPVGGATLFVLNIERFEKV